MTDTRSMASFFRKTCIATMQVKCQVKPIWTLMKQEMMGWHWHQLDHMQITCALLLAHSHASRSSLNFLRVWCSSWCPTNSITAL